MSERPQVRRVPNARGSHIEPPLDQSWSEIQKLLWHAAVIEVDADLHLDIRETDRGYLVLAAGFGSPFYSFHDAWSRMNSLARGAEMYRAQHSNQHAGGQ